MTEQQIQATEIVNTISSNDNLGLIKCSIEGIDALCIAKPVFKDNELSMIPLAIVMNGNLLTHTKFEEK